MSRDTILRKASLLLLDGADVDAIVAACAPEAAGDAEANTVVEGLAANPLLQAIQILRMRLRARDWYLRTQHALAQMGNHPPVVPDARGDISRAAFLERHYCVNRPAYFPGLASTWPAITRWTAGYLGAICGSVQVEVMGNRNRAPIEHQYFHQRLKQVLPFADYLALVYSGAVTNDNYMVSRNRFFAHPETHALLNDLQPPAFVQINDPGEDVRMWLGPAGTVTPLHFDGNNSLLVQLSGRKRIRLYGPHQSSEMRQSGLFYADTTAPMVSVAADGEVIDVEPGDAVFIPVGWWHSVIAFEASMTLSFTNFGVLNSFGSP